MSDILIRGMEKPGSCCECDFCEVQDINFETLYFCNRNDRFLDDEEACNIPNDCPIHELPEHGDLIDRDAFDADVRKRYCSTCNNYNGTKCRACWVDDMLGDVADFEAVIPSNKEDDE